MFVRRIGRADGVEYLIWRDVGDYSRAGRTAGVIPNQISKGISKATAIRPTLSVGPWRSIAGVSEFHFRKRTIWDGSGLLAPRLRCPRLAAEAHLLSER
jgi:hypothetical protein